MPQALQEDALAAVTASEGGSSEGYSGYSSSARPGTSSSELEGTSGSETNDRDPRGGSSSSCEELTNSCSSSSGGSSMQDSSAESGVGSSQRTKEDHHQYHPCRHHQHNSSNSNNSSSNNNEDNNSQSVEQENGNVSSNGAHLNRAARGRDQARKLRRSLANRKSARGSRERRKRLLKQLQESIDTLAEENRAIAETNLAMRQQLVRLLMDSGLAVTLQQL